MNLLKRVETKILSDALPYLQFDHQNQAIWLKDGSVTRAIEIVPKSILSITEGELESLRSGLIEVLNQAPEGALLQFLFIREKTSEQNDLAACKWKTCHAAGEKVGLNNQKGLLFDSKLDLLNAHAMPAPPRM